MESTETAATPAMPQPAKTKKKATKKNAAPMPTQSDDLKTKAMALMPKLADVTVGKYDAFKIKWVKQASLLPQNIRSKLKLTVVMSSRGDDIHPEEFWLNGKSIVINKNEEQEIPLDQYLNLANKYELQETERTVQLEDGRLKRERNTVRLPVYDLTIVPDENQEKVQQTIHKYIKDIG